MLSRTTVNLRGFSLTMYCTYVDLCLIYLLFFLGSFMFFFEGGVSYIQNGLFCSL